MVRENKTGAPPGQREDALLLIADLLVEFLIDRHEGFAFILWLKCFQVGGTVGVAGDAGMGVSRVADAQDTAHQDDGDEAPGGSGRRPRLAGSSTCAMTCWAR